MPISFPNSPSVNDTYTINGRTFIWNGAKWKRLKPRLTPALPTIDVSNDFSAGNVLHVDSDTGRVGIGTSSPLVDLHVDGNVEFTGTLDVSGVVTAPTAVSSTNDTTVATTAYVTTAVSNLIDGAPGALDTLNELAAALADDASYATSITNALALKLDSSSYTASDILTKIKTVDGASSGLDADTLDGSHASAFAASSHAHSYLPLSGGSLTGHVTHNYNIATPANYYNGLQVEVKATSGTAGIGLHRSGYSHVGIYTDAQNVLKFNMNSGTVTLNHNTGTIWGSGNDGSGSGLDADTLDGYHASSFHINSYSNDVTCDSVYADNWFRAKGDTGLYFEDKGTGIRSPLSEGGQYGSVATYGNEGGWDGFSLGGRVVFMHNLSNNWGIYNDVNNEWMIYGALNGSVDLYYNNSRKFYTESNGVYIDGIANAYRASTSSGWDHMQFEATTSATGNSTAGITGHLPGLLAGVFRVWYGNGEGWDSGNSGGTGYRFVGASSFVTRSSERWKKNIHSRTDDEIIPKAMNLLSCRTAVWDEISLDPVCCEDGESFEEPEMCEDPNCDCEHCTEIRNDPIQRRHFGRRGYIVEELEQVFPDAIFYERDGKPSGIDYSVVTAELMDIVKLLVLKNDEQDRTIADLTSRLEVQEAS